MLQPLDIEVRGALERCRGTWPRIAAQCGVSHSWISKFVRGKIPNPGFATLQSLQRVLAGLETVTQPGALDEVRDAA
jgi:transcriptional regulator with XRE-family HTH domain